MEGGEVSRATLSSVNCYLFIKSLVKRRSLLLLNSIQMFSLKSPIFRVIWNIEWYFSMWFEILKLSSFQPHTLASLNYISYVFFEWKPVLPEFATRRSRKLKAIASRNNHSLVLVKRNFIHFKKWLSSFPYYIFMIIVSSTTDGVAFQQRRDKLRLKMSIFTLNLF